MLPNACHVERRSDGAIVVRVRSHDKHGRPLPDAVFAFRLGDCQYAKWDQYLRKQQSPAEHQQAGANGITNGNGTVNGNGAGKANGAANGNGQAARSGKVSLGATRQAV